MPPGPFGLNTGRPIAPWARYRTIAEKPATGPRNMPTSRTAKFCSVSGTGVKGSGRYTWAHTATKTDEAIVRTTLPVTDSGRVPEVCVRPDWEEMADCM